MEVGPAACESLGDGQRIAGLEQDVQPPRLDLCGGIAANTYGGNGWHLGMVRAPSDSTSRHPSRPGREPLPALRYRVRVTLSTSELERAAVAAAAHAPGREPTAVMAVDPRDGRRYLVVFGSQPPFAYLLVNAAGRPETSRRLVRDAVTLIALAERADEVAGAVAGEDVAAAFSAAAARLREHGDEPAAAAAGEVAAAYRALVEEASGPREATPAYLDRIGARAAAAAAALDAYAEQARRLGADAGGGAAEPLASAAYEALRTAARAGDPGTFAASLGSGAGAVEALAAEVLESYLVDLRG